MSFYELLEGLAQIFKRECSLLPEKEDNCIKLIPLKKPKTFLSWRAYKFIRAT